MCYIEAQTASYDAKNNQVRIEAIDLDQVILNSWDAEFNAKPIEICFDLGARGPRIYLFKLLRSVVKDDCSTLSEMVSKLPGKIFNISSNFIVKSKG